MDYQWVEELLKSLIKGHRLMDPTAWASPNPFLLDPLFEDLWLEKIQELKRAATEKKISFRALAEAMPGPACVRKEFRWALWGMKLYDWPIEKRIEIIEFYKNILAAKAPADIFNIQQALWHSEEEINEIVKQTNWQKATPESRRIVSQLSANCPPLAWGLFTDFFYHRAYEVYGLYKNVEKYQPKFLTNSSLIIRQFGPFAAPELWSHTKKYPAYQIVMKTIYSDIETDFDYINHFTSPNNLPERLSWFCVEIDGQPVTDFEKLRAINQEIMSCAVEQDGYLKKLDGEGQKRHTMMSKMYSFKELFNKAGLSWEPSQRFFERIKDRPLLKINFSKFKDANDVESFWRELFDPFHPLARPELLEAKKQISNLNFSCCG